jgi:hypothetical protein
VPDDPDPGNDRQSADRLAAAAAELYELAPDEFTGRRGELATAARAAGDRPAAKAIGALRRPTRAAWVANRLARTDPAAAARLAALGAALDAAQRAGEAARLRELSRERWALLDALTAQALSAAGVDDPPPPLRDEVSQTLAAALADPGVAAEFAAGTLTRAARWSGFGLVPDGGSGSSAGDGADHGMGAWAATVTTAATRTAGRTAPSPEAAGERARPARTRSAKGTPTQGTRAPAAPAPAAPAERRAAEARRRAEEAERQAAAARQQAAEQAARRREQYAEAERAAAAAAETAAAASGDEDCLAAEVRDLEQRLTQARTDLAAARMRARRTEVAERRAAQALDRLPRP